VHNESPRAFVEFLKQEGLLERKVEMELADSTKMEALEIFDRSNLLGQIEPWVSRRTKALRLAIQTALIPTLHSELYPPLYPKGKATGLVVDLTGTGVSIPEPTEDPDHVVPSLEVDDMFLSLAGDGSGATELGRDPHSLAELYEKMVTALGWDVSKFGALAESLGVRSDLLRPVLQPISNFYGSVNRRVMSSSEVQTQYESIRSLVDQLVDKRGAKLFGGLADFYAKVDGAIPVSDLDVANINLFALSHGIVSQGMDLGRILGKLPDLTDDEKRLSTYVALLEAYYVGVGVEISNIYLNDIALIQIFKQRTRSQVVVIEENRSAQTSTVYVIPAGGSALEDYLKSPDLDEPLKKFIQNGGVIDGNPLNPDAPRKFHPPLLVWDRILEGFKEAFVSNSERLKKLLDRVDNLGLARTGSDGKIEWIDDWTENGQKVFLKEELDLIWASVMASINGAYGWKEGDPHFIESIDEVKLVVQGHEEAHRWFLNNPAPAALLLTAFDQSLGKALGVQYGKFIQDVAVKLFKSDSLPADANEVKKMVLTRCQRIGTG
jgi:hypothetical protein